MVREGGEDNDDEADNAADDDVADDDVADDDVDDDDVAGDDGDDGGDEADDVDDLVRAGGEVQCSQVAGGNITIMESNQPTVGLIVIF